MTLLQKSYRRRKIQKQKIQKNGYKNMFEKKNTRKLKEYRKSYQNARNWVLQKFYFCCA